MSSHNPHQPKIKSNVYWLESVILQHIIVYQNVLLQFKQFSKLKNNKEITITLYIKNEALKGIC